MAHQASDDIRGFGTTVRVIMQLKIIKAQSPRDFRVDDYHPEDDPERRRRIETHRRRIRRELRRHST